MTVNWLYKGKEINSIEDFPEGCIGFCYLIVNTKTGQYYIGKKSLQHNIKRKIGKKAKALIEGKGRKPNFERIQKESDWKDYFSSSDIIKEDIKKNGCNHYKREILEFAFDKRQLTYLEVRYQFQYNVLENDLSLNNNILGKFYKNLAIK